jgi:hypothetical protein
MSAFWGGRRLGILTSVLTIGSQWVLPSRHGYCVDTVSTALAILVVLIDFETEWPRPIRGGVCQDAWVVMVMECVGSGGCGTAVDLSEMFKSVQAPPHVTLLIVEL